MEPSTQLARSCNTCSAPNLGTRFCESCGAPASVQPTNVQPLRAPEPATPTKTNTLAVLALVFGILGSLLGIIFGHIALGQIRRTGESGQGLAVVGLVFGYLWIAALVIVFIALGAVASSY